MTKPADDYERCFKEPCSYAYGGYDDSYRSGNRDRLTNDQIKVQAAVPGKSYSWRDEGYTSCSASCLGGVEELIINCVRDDTGKVVSPYLCSPETKPENRIRTCNDIPCPPRWNYSDYSPCTKSCGIGIKTREINCIHEVTRGGENTMIVPNSMCPHPPPPDRQYCNVLDCPARWEVGEQFYFYYEYYKFIFRLASGHDAQNLAELDIKIGQFCASKQWHRTIK